MARIARRPVQPDHGGARLLFRCALCSLWLVVVCFAEPANAAHPGHEGQPDAEAHDPTGPGYEIPNASFRVFLDRGTERAASGTLDHADADAAVETVIRAFTFLLHQRTEYPRFDEAVRKGLLDRVIIEPTVVNREGKAFPFLVARTADQGRVKLLISASLLKDRGYLGHADRFAPVLAREFQWVVSKADTSPKPKTISVERDLRHAPIRTDKEIQELSEDERVRLLQRLFETYLNTVDEQKSLEGQPYYDVGTTTPAPPAQPDSTIKFYDIRVREALQKIAREPYFLERIPNAVKSLLNGKIWNVAFVKIDQRDWATRTRVLPEDKAVMVGEPGRPIQPAAILVNAYRTAAPDDPFYSDTKGLPMGALSADQLALVIAKEIQHNLVEKSLTGHVAQDALTAPK